MTIDEQQHGAVRVLKPHGPLVDADASMLKDRIAESMCANLGRVVLDLSAVPFVDSRGLEILVDLSEEMAGSGQTLKLCAVNKTIREVFELTDLSSQFDQFDDTTAAVRSFL